VPAPIVKVELGLNLGSRDPNAFILDNDPRGKLDSVTYTLGGDRFFDITDRLVSVETSRGKNNSLDRIDSGIASITVDNFDRKFDPLYAAGPYFGELVPRRAIRITSNNQPVFVGAIDDFDIQYAPGNQSKVGIQSSDAFSVLTNSGLAEFTPSTELSGARVNAVLDRAEVAWPAEERLIDTGDSTLQGVTVREGTAALAYLQLVNNSEFGNLFIAKDGKVVFQERNAVPNIPNIVFSDEVVAGEYLGIQFSSVNNVYGSENLYNRVVISNASTPALQAIAEDTNSQLNYGVRTYEATGLLIETQEQLQNLADFLLARFKEPQYRFDRVSVILDTISTSNQDAVLDLEIGDIVLIRFEPSDIPPAIEQYCRIIGINHTWEQSVKTVNFALETLDFGIFILDNAVLGTLDDDRLSY
jgi:hypothetical protein